MKEVRCWVNGRTETGVNVAERALQYGDGLFETIRVRYARPEYLGRHLQRLSVGCERLKFPSVDWALVRQELEELAGQQEEAVLKYILGRGEGGRGYHPGPGLTVTRIASIHPLPYWPRNPDQDGVRARICTTRLAVQPLLAGLKHLNRLEQVMARAEWDDQDIAEGFMLDTGGQLIEGTMSNVFMVNAGELVTPDLSQCGVAGVMRSVILDIATTLGFKTRIQPLTLDDLKSSQEVFICNCLAGIWPVVHVEGLGEFGIGRITRQMQVAMQADGNEDSVNWYKT